MILNLEVFIIVLIFVGRILTNSVMWKKVILDNIYLKRDDFSNTFKTKSKLICGTICAKNHNFNIWCHDDIETCILSSVVVSPRYVTKSHDFSTCFTKKRKDLAVGVITNSFEPKMNTNSNSTTDGIFLKGFKIHFC